MKQLLVAFTALIATTVFVAAHQFEKSGLLIVHPWTRATPEGATVGAGYLTITNNGKETDRLTGGAFEGADHVEIHEMKMDGDKMTMRQFKDGVEIQPGATVKFNPGSYHMMLMGLKKPIAKGPNIKGSLTFEKAGSVDIDYKVENIGAMDSSDADTGKGDMKMDDSKMMHDHMQ
ncbi:copper chaperone PCu(A)C [Hyphomicrobium sp.]|uniref:copper chaperone PCu(A)C n=1 Tax=Hyphomicrobium sp. TaxID=82 RepID=UPI001E04D595|nr:copper chaperone PCu(A)C [Hyphomicrobium sp.]MBY0560265.1 copper chaperone PCu(A)C [Hyphomicrobium sp.]